MSGTGCGTVTVEGRGMLLYILANCSSYAVNRLQEWVIVLSVQIGDFFSLPFTV